MNAEGYKLLGAVIARDASLKKAVATGDCKTIAASLSWMPFELTPVDVHYAIKDLPEYPQPKHNAGELRKRIDGIPELFSARLSCQLRGAAGVGGLQAIVNELNRSPNPAEHVSVEDVDAAMGLSIEPAPANPVAGTVELVGQSALGDPAKR
jgi:hypothetical protein